LGNSGSATFPLTASQLYVILSLVGVALALAIVLALIWRFRQSRVGPPSVGVEYEHYL
jgi:TRAP-type C4-dicarboxylate transport system permease small subunit